LAHILIGEPVPTPDQVRGRLSPEHALGECFFRSPARQAPPAVSIDLIEQDPVLAQRAPANTKTAPARSRV